MSFAVLGGLLLNLGAFLTFKGRIYAAVGTYLFADLCWAVMAYERGEFWGVLSIGVGFTFGLLAFLKMSNGEMSKSINKEED